jgi:hypothetical protein
MGDVNRFFEFQGEGRSRHTDMLRQVLDCPAMRGIVVHRGDRRAHLPIRQCEEPPHATLQAFRKMQPQGLNQHHVGEMLRDQRATRLRFAQLLHHPFQRPAHRRPI